MEKKEIPTCFDGGKYIGMIRGALSGIDSEVPGE